MNTVNKRKHRTSEDTDRSLAQAWTKYFLELSERYEEDSDLVSLCFRNAQKFSSRTIISS